LAAKVNKKSDWQSEKSEKSTQNTKKKLQTVSQSGIIEDKSQKKPRKSKE